MPPRLRPAPPGFVDLASLIPGLRLDLRYHTTRNFTGAPLPGYGAPGAWLTEQAGAALARAQRALQAQGLGLLLFDAYRPARAARAMVDWARAQGREELLSGYISPTSRHSRGIAVDAGLCSASGEPLAMGSDFDAFEPAAHTLSATGQPLARRLLLASTLSAEGFVPYPREWWHFERPQPGAEPCDVPYGADEPLPD